MSVDITEPMEWLFYSEMKETKYIILLLLL